MLDRLMQDCWQRGIRLSRQHGEWRVAPESAKSQAPVIELQAHGEAVTRWLDDHPGFFDARPLTDNEQALWFLHRLAPDSCAYNIGYAGRLLDRQLPADFQARLAQTWLAVQQRHPLLCAPFAERDGRAMQRVDQARPSPLRCETLQAADAPALRHRIDAIIDAPFNLADGEVTRAVLLSNRQDETPVHYLVLTLHHIVSDLDTLHIVIDELFELLHQRPLPPVEGHAYRDWACELAAAAAQGEDEELAWWRAELDDAPPLELPTDFPRGDSQAFEGGEVSRRVDAQTHRRLCEQARGLGVTPHAYWFALLQQFFGLLSGQDDFVLGTPCGLRLKAGQRRLTGYMVNPLPIRCRLRPTLSSADWARQVAADLKRSFRHRRYPFARLVKRLDPPRQEGRAPLFQHLFTLNKMNPMVGEQDMQRLMAEQRGAAHELNLVVVEDIEGFHCQWRYSTALYRRESVERYADQFLALLRACLDNPEVPFNRLCWLPEAQLSSLRGEALEVPFDGAWQAFLGQCRQRPRAIALDDDQGTLDYATLAQAVAGRAGRLREAVDPRGGRIALCLPRGRELVMHMLAAWQTGAAYVALDPAWPDERLRQIADDARPCLWIGQGERPQWLPQAVRWLTPPTLEPRGGEGAAWPAPDAGAPAYVVYTSGSSGRPKGVEISQGNLMHYVAACLQRLALDEDASLTSLASCATDLGHTALFGALLSGRRLRLLDEALAFDAEGLAEVLGKRPVDLLKIVPSHLNALLVASDPARLLPRRCLVVGGEALGAELVARLRGLKPDMRIVNHYGPSETTVGVLTHAVGEEARVPLGRPLANVRIAVRGAAGVLLPAGAIGELYVEGPTVALGYLGDDASQAERFGEWGYRTGDRVRLDEQGRVLFLGRVDDQVKIRGYRVEPAEVAERLRALAAVSDARVLNCPAPPAGNRLVAFLVAEPAHLERIQREARECLPDYMLPALWLCLPRFELLANGKVDRRALHAQVARAAAPERAADEAPAPVADGPQAVLLQIAREILGQPALRAEDDFFAAGGDSILSLQIIARARQQGLKITPKQVFAHPSVVGWAQQAVALRTPATAPVATAEPDQPFALTPIQDWFFERQVDAPGHWNQSLLLALKVPLDPQRFAQAVARLLQRHATLRLVFQHDGSAWRQRYQPWSPALAQAAFVQAEGEPDDERLQAQQQGLRLDTAPLIRWVHFPLSGHLLCTAHHLVVDAVSWQVLMEELESLYLDPERPLPSTSAGFHLWSEALRAHRQTPRLQAQLDYWRGQLPAPKPVPVPDNCFGDSRTLQTRLSASSTAHLLGDCHAAYGTQVQDLLVAALAAAVGAWQGERQVSLELESHGRTALDNGPDLSRSIGWHTSRYPLRITLDDQPEAAIVAAKEALRRVPEQGIGYGLLRQGDAQALGSADLLTFNYLGQSDHWFCASRLWRLDRPMCPGMRAAESRRTHLLDVNALVLDGCLVADWRYAPQMHERAWVAQLAEDFQRRLEALLAHCLSPSVGRATASDFADADLSDDEFLGLLEQLEP